MSDPFMSNIWFKRSACLATFLLLAGIAFALHSKSSSTTSILTGGFSALSVRQKPVVYIDAGHGGIDPGKVGINHALEKDVNLSIVMKLKNFLEASDVEVVLTRDTDQGLYDENNSNKKVQDMKNRVRKIEESRPVLVVSIHQNSYHEEYVHGAQVFYYETSAEGKQAAEILQDQLVRTLDPDNHRTAKANDSYYLLKKTSAPIVIAECGFLSNSTEAAKLIDDTYQERVAWAIHLGILRYLNH